ncbi:MAG: 50S ribosomal protein L32 [Planctomycetota bacterium]
MAVPKRRQSNSRTGRRRAHDFLTPKQLQSCPKCKTARPSHVVCPNCGDYMGRSMTSAEEGETA